MSVIDRSQDARQSVGPIGKRRRLVVWTSRRGTHLGSGHVRPRQQTGHMIASDRIHTNKTLATRGPSTYGSRRSMLCEKSREPRKRRIVFSIAISWPRLPVELVSVSMKLRQMFYTQIERRTFHR